MNNLYLTAQFKDDLDGLDPQTRRQVTGALHHIETNPRYPGLGTEKQSVIRGRSVFRSRVTRKYRMLWEWQDGGGIALWRVGHHEMIDAVTSLPGVTDVDLHQFRRKAAAPSTGSLAPEAGDPLFTYFHDNHLRLLGVPDEALSAVRAILDPDEVFNLPVANNVQWTLYAVLEHGVDEAVNSFLDASKLLYRTTADQLAGYCEGKIKRLLLNLTPEQASYVHIDASGPVLIKGVAGSGKTTIGLYRAQYLAELIAEKRAMFDEETRVLVLTYTSTLAGALRELLVELYGEELESLHVQTFDGWTIQHLRQTLGHLDIIDKESRHDLAWEVLRELQERYPDNEFLMKQDIYFFLEEIDQVIYARNLQAMDEYQAVERVGRGQGLDRERHRPLVWHFFTRFRLRLQEMGKLDFADLPRLLLENPDSLPAYDAIIIDEAQDLKPVQLQVAALLDSVNPDSHGLTLLADPAQSIYYKGIPWKEGGVNIRGGRTRTLAKNFRNSRQILAAARCIIDHCQTLQAQGEFIAPTSVNRDGPKPLLARYAHREQGVDFLIEEILQLCQSGQYRPGDVAILARQKNSFDTLYIKDRLAKAHLPWVFFRSNKFQLLENEVKLVTMHSAKGLEFPVVFIVDLLDGILPNRHSTSEPEKLDQERKLLYVSMTRAAERLYLLYPRAHYSRFIRDIEEATVRMVDC
jgi:superfamily I DNA/RNA helicase/mRNA-degrading endonuclease RelE of RelBE toxin-antitoxin system